MASTTLWRSVSVLPMFLVWLAAPIAANAQVKHPHMHHAAPA